MLFMVIEHFKNGDPGPIRDRFQTQGRMMPDGVEYIASWVDAEHARCFQVMEADSAESLEPWVAKWNDIVDFEIIPVHTSQDYWARFAAS